jgi:tRNA threonylcarbamoyladenosine modification (KEOPS) complex  Pcc1 subunit
MFIKGGSMKSTSLFLVIIFLAVSLSAGEKSYKRVRISDPEKACNFVITAIRNEDSSALLSILNSYNRSSFIPMNEKRMKNLMKHIAYSKKNIGSATKVTEIRKGPGHKNKGTIVGKIRVDKKYDEVYVVVMTLENGCYYFEDINSPSTRMYNRLVKIK